MKSKITMIVFGLFLTTNLFAQIPVKGLVGWYPFSGNANDYSDYNNNGTVNGATLTSDRFGNPNSAYSFDGISNNILIHSDTNIVPFNKTNYTVSLWCNYSGNGVLMQIFTGTNGTNISNYDLSVNNGKIGFVNYPFYQVGTNSSTNISTNTWVHLLVSYDQVKDTVSIYQNTNLLFKAPLSNTPPKAGLISIGAIINNQGAFKGSIDDIRIYNRALNQSEILALYNENSCSNYTSRVVLPDYVNSNGLIAYYPFNNDTKDYSGNNLDGINNGATPTTDRFGVANKAYYFDGVSNGILVNNNSNFSFTTNMSITAWVNLQKIQTNPIVSKWSSQGGYSYVLEAQSDSTVWFFVNSGGVSNTLKGKMKLKPNQNYLVTSTYNGSNFKLYINGILDNTMAYSNPIVTGTSDIEIGKRNNISAFYKGSIDEVKIYNRALTQQEITNIFSENSCTSLTNITDTLTIQSVTGFNSLPSDFGTVKVYPNPTKSVLNISVSNPTNNFTVQIANSQGSVVYNGSLTNANTQINLSSLGANGLYFIRILDSGNNVVDVRKIILE